jgi:hypothetical protein
MNRVLLPSLPPFPFFILFLSFCSFLPFLSFSRPRFLKLSSESSCWAIMCVCGLSATEAGDSTAQHSTSHHSTAQHRRGGEREGEERRGEERRGELNTAQYCVVQQRVRMSKGRYGHGLGRTGSRVSLPLGTKYAPYMRCTSHSSLESVATSAMLCSVCVSLSLILPLR